MLLPLLIQLGMLDPKHGGTGDNASDSGSSGRARGGVWKPTGLTETRTRRVPLSPNRSPEALPAESEAKETPAPASVRWTSPPAAPAVLRPYRALSEMTQAEIDAEIRERMQPLLEQWHRRQDDEAIAMILLAAASIA